MAGKHVVQQQGRFLEHGILLSLGCLEKSIIASFHSLDFFWQIYHFAVILTLMKYFRIGKIFWLNVV
jgi:hypothetical protein